MPKEIREAKLASIEAPFLSSSKIKPTPIFQRSILSIKSLTGLQMFHSAQHYYTKVVEHGPSNQYFNSSLARLVSIARLTGDDFDLKRVILKNRISPDLFPRKAKSHLHYLLGILYYDDKNPKYAMALKNFEKVSPNSVLYLKSRYIEGVIYTQQEKLKSAVRAFRDVYSERERIEPADLEKTADWRSNRLSSTQHCLDLFQLKTRQELWRIIQVVWQSQPLEPILARSLI